MRTAFAISSVVARTPQQVSATCARRSLELDGQHVKIRRSRSSQGCVLLIGTSCRTHCAARDRAERPVSHQILPVDAEINGFDRGRRTQPWSRVAGIHSSATRPQRSARLRAIASSAKIKIASSRLDQSCQDSSRIHAINGVEQLRICSVDASDMTTLRQTSYPNKCGKTADRCNVPGVTLKYGQQKRTRLIKIATALIALVAQRT